MDASDISKNRDINDRDTIVYFYGDKFADKDKYDDKLIDDMIKQLVSGYKNIENLSLCEYLDKFDK